MRHLLAVAAFLALASPAYAGVKLTESDAHDETLKAAGREAQKVRVGTDDLVAYNVTGCTRKTRMRFSCRYTLTTKPLRANQIETICYRRVRVTKASGGAIKTRTFKRPCEPYVPPTSF